MDFLPLLQNCGQRINYYGETKLLWEGGGYIHGGFFTHGDQEDCESYID